jgi:hypothetical protein
MSDLIDARLHYQQHYKPKRIINRITPEHIKSLNEGGAFVFGSNDNGGSSQNKPK